MLFNLNDGVMNGFEIAFLQSEEYADRVIRQFKNQYTENDDPNELLNSIVSNMNLGGDDLMPDSVTRIENEITNYLEAL